MIDQKPIHLIKQQSSRSELAPVLGRRKSKRQPVRWGDPTYDEMMIGWADYVVPNTGKRDTALKAVK